MGPKQPDQRHHHGCCQWVGKIPFEIIPRRTPPGDQRTNPHEQEQGISQRHGDLIKKRRAYTHLHAAYGLCQHWEDRTQKNGKGDGNKDHIIGEEGCFTGKHGIKLCLAAQIIESIDQSGNGEEQQQTDKYQEKGAQGRVGEGVHGGNDAASSQKGAE